MNKIDLIIDALSDCAGWGYKDDEKIDKALTAARELQQELAKPEMPAKIFGPNLEQILNAAGFYRREWVGLTDEDIEGILDCDRGWLVDIKKVEQILKEKNT